MACRCGPRAKSTTSAPARASLRAEIAADRAGAGDDDLHCAVGAKAWATMRRWILPVAVRGIASVMWICLGRLNSASCSLQKASSSASVAVPLSVDRGGHLLAPHLVRHAEAHGLGDGRVGQQHLVDLARRDLLAAAVDHLLEAADSVR